MKTRCEVWCPRRANKPWLLYRTAFVVWLCGCLLAQCSGRGERVSGAGGSGAGDGRAYSDGDSASPVDNQERRPDRCARPRTGRRAGQLRATHGAAGRTVSQTRRTTNCCRALIRCTRLLDHAQDRLEWSRCRNTLY